MFRSAVVSLLALVAFALASAQVPIASCVLSATASEKACELGCCANKSCCEDSPRNTAPPAQPLAKSSHDVQLLALAPVAIALLPERISPPHFASSSSEILPMASVPSRLALLCTFLI